MTNQKVLIEDIVPLVTINLRQSELFETRVGDSAIRRLARRVKRIDRLIWVAKADQMDQPPKKFEGFPASGWFLERSRELEIEDSAPKQIIMERHLIELGLEPGPRFGQILKACYEC